MLCSFDFISGCVKFEECLHLLLIILIVQFYVCFQFTLGLNTFQDEVSPALFYACARRLAYAGHESHSFGHIFFRWWIILGSESAVSLEFQRAVIYWGCSYLLVERQFIEISEILEKFVFAGWNFWEVLVAFVLHKILYFRFWLKSIGTSQLVIKVHPRFGSIIQNGALRCLIKHWGLFC